MLCARIYVKVNVITALHIKIHRLVLPQEKILFFYNDTRERNGDINFYNENFVDAKLCSRGHTTNTLHRDFFFIRDSPQCWGFLLSNTQCNNQQT